MNSSDLPANDPSARLNPSLHSVPLHQPEPDPQNESDPPSRGPNLIILYLLLALALVAAISFAAAIVWPFYLRR